jgi:hypothetical protein
MNVLLIFKKKRASNEQYSETWKVYKKRSIDF